MPEGNPRLDMLKRASYAGSKSAEEDLKSLIVSLESELQANKNLRIEEARSGSAVTDNLILSEVIKQTPNRFDDNLEHLSQELLIPVFEIGAASDEVITIDDDEDGGGAGAAIEEIIEDNRAAAEEIIEDNRAAAEETIEDNRAAARGNGRDHGAPGPQHHDDGILDDGEDPEIQNFQEDNRDARGASGSMGHEPQNLDWSNTADEGE